MKEIEQNFDELHNEAMLLAERALSMKKGGNVNRDLPLFAQAFDFECQAAMLYVNDYENEPRRSVFFRSAAWMAFHAEEFREAERMACFGLSGEPPAPVNWELRDVLTLCLAYFHSISTSKKCSKKREKQ